MIVTALHSKLRLQSCVQMLYRLCHSQDDNLPTYVPLTSLSETIKSTYAGGRIFLDQPLILALCLPEASSRRALSWLGSCALCRRQSTWPHW